RVREKQRDAAQPIVIQSGSKPDNSEAIAAREARKAEARARKAEQQAAVESTTDASDPRKAAVEAAIARAKARKAAQQVENAAPSAESETTVEAVPAVDPRKAA
ncbi:electron transport complex subunit RsxC, partial [Klebsiella aerogenes]